MWDTLVEIALVFFFVFLNGFFVAAEFAIVKVRSTQIDSLIAKKHRRAKIAKELITHLDAYLSATQLGITMASLALGWIGEPFVASMLRPPLQDLGVQDPRIIQAVSFGVAFSIITFLHIILGELAPKSLAIQKALGTTLAVSYPLKLFYVTFKPIIWSLNSLANAILRAVGLTAVNEAELMHSQEELRLLLAQEKNVSPTSKNIVLNAMDFRLKQARHIMVPRREMVALSLTLTRQQIIEAIRSTKFTRFPVYQDSLDNIVGIVNTKDIFRHDRHLQPDFSLESVLRDAMFLPETASLETTLETMLQKKVHMMILVDEYGGTAGLVTLEDVLEELVGTIQDEYDREPPEVTRVSENEFIVDASLTTNEVERLLNQELSQRDILSVGAFLIERLGHLPRKGESLRINGTEFTVEEMSDRAIEKIRVKRLDPPPANRDDEPSA
jgi:CBS domain containing-hemolysin-like protein